MPLEEDIVISGVGLRLPEANSLDELSTKIRSGETFITPNEGDDSLQLSYSGKVRDVLKFDNVFFGIPKVVTGSMDLTTRHILETTFEALVDAGINPLDLKGTNASVYTGITICDHDLSFLGDRKGGYNVMGTNKCMNSNRISFWLDVNGTSICIDSWTGGAKAVELALQAIREEKCDTAIIAAASITRAPSVTVQMGDLGLLSPDGKCRAFDDNANGYARSDGAIVFVLQKVSKAKRCYAIVDQALASAYYDGEYIPFKPSQKYWEDMLTQFYTNYKGDLNELHYLEAHGSGIKEDDVMELNAVSNILCRDRSRPLLLGSVKSALGHTEGSATSTSIVKAILSFESGVLHHTYNYEKPNQQCHGLQEGKLKVVNENTPLPRNSVLAINVQGLSGATYGHIVLRPNPKEKTTTYDGIPRLVLLADRTEAFLPDLLNKVESMPFDAEYIRLLHEVYSKKINMYLARGYTILPKPEKGAIHESVTISEVKQPVWFIFSGMGSQWPMMGKRLMDLPIFRESIDKCHKVLLPKGLDLIHIITEANPKIFDNILHSFVGIAAIQVALVDMLAALGIVPDGMIGHSVGELGCAYADGCLTAEQMMLAAYSRGKASIETELIKGFMAAIGKGYNEIKDELPEGIEVACRNSVNSCTISGPAQQVQDYVEQLKKKGIFARTVNVANIAYHSRYIKPAAPKLLEYLKQVIPEPKLRTSRWVSTSILEKDWNTDLARYCSAEYHTNNLLSAVYFEEGSTHIPSDAICIEIAPHGLLQAILKRSLGDGVVNIPMTNRSTEDPLHFLLMSIGKMFMVGLHPQVANLYPAVEFPVSRGTPSLHNLVHWQHDFDFKLLMNEETKKVTFSLKEKLFKVSRNGFGYIVNDVNIYPLSVILFFVWDIFSRFQQRKLEDCPIVLEKFKLHQVQLKVAMDYQDVQVFIQRGSGLFEVTTKEGTIIASGRISNAADPLKDSDPAGVSQQPSKTLSTAEIYRELRSRGCQVSPYLHVLQSATQTEQATTGNISIRSDWSEVFEGLVQLLLLEKGQSAESVLLPRSVESITIVPSQYLKHTQSLAESDSLQVSYLKVQNTLRCPGIEIKGLQVDHIPRDTTHLKFESIKFIPYFDLTKRDATVALECLYNIVQDNLVKELGDKALQVSGLTSNGQSTITSKHFKDQFIAKEVKYNIASQGKLDLALVSGLSAIPKALGSLQEGGFCLVETSSDADYTSSQQFRKEVVSQVRGDKNKHFVLLRKLFKTSLEPQYIVNPANDTTLIRLLEPVTAGGRVCVVLRKEPQEGFSKFKSRVEAHTTASLIWLLILDQTAPKFTPNDPFYADQIQRGLRTNVYRSGTWGHFYSRTFSARPSSELVVPDKLVTLDYIAAGSSKDSPVVEYSGRLTAQGSRVMGLAERKGHSVEPDPCLTWEVPPGLKAEEAATLPLAYSQAYYSLVVRGKLKQFESLMVTDACSCHGRAAISVAFSRCKNIIATVTNQKEADIISKTFPELHPKNIIIHSEKTLAAQIGELTEDEYPEVVYNSLEGEGMLEAFQCIGKFGRLFHLGRSDLDANTQLGMSVFIKSTSVYMVSAESIIALPDHTKRDIHEAVVQGLRKGEVKPLPWVHSTHAAVRLANESGQLCNKKKQLVGGSTLKATHSGLQIQAQATYLLIDDSDTWMDIAESIARKGARRVHVVVNATTNSKAQEYKTNYKCDITVHNAATSEQVQQLAQQQLAAVFIVSMKQNEVTEEVRSLSDSWRCKTGHLVVVSRQTGPLSTLCTTRRALGLPSTNYVWHTSVAHVARYLDKVLETSGQEDVVHVTSAKNEGLTVSASRVLLNMLPRTVEEYYDLGTSLNEVATLVEMSTRAGLSHNQRMELSPIFIIPGLQGDPTKALAPLARKIMYPTFCVKHLSVGFFSVQNTASCLLEPVIKASKGRKSVNIIGVSWGTTVAIEMTSQLEEKGYRVGLVLIDGPLKSLRETLLSWESVDKELLHLIPGASEQADNEPGTWAEKLRKAVSNFSLPASRHAAVERAVFYLRNSLGSFIEYDFHKLPLKGPVTIVQSSDSGETYNYEISRSTTTVQVPYSLEETLTSAQVQVVLNSAPIADSMKETTFRDPWTALEDFLEEDKIDTAVPTYFDPYDVEKPSGPLIPL